MELPVSPELTERFLIAEPGTVGERVDRQLDLAREVAEGEVSFFLKAAASFLSPERAAEKSVEMSWGWGVTGGL